MKRATRTIATRSKRAAKRRTAGQSSGSTRSRRDEIEKRERRVDEGLKETFPASDTPTFVGKGAPKPGPRE
jgi:hypothetical protein